MATASEAGHNGTSFRNPPVVIALCLFLAIAAFFLWEEHRAHVLGILPYLLLAACPVIHLFMHRGHHRHHQDDPHGDAS